ncbi:MAG: polyphenol oxidase family protein [Actinomycetes bacterium]
MFVYRHDPDADLGVGVAFTSAALDLSDRQDAGARRVAYDRLCRAIGVPVAVARQVHGDRVVVATAQPDSRGLVDLTRLEADALVTTQRGLGVAVRVADCVPILVADEGGTVAAAVHAGREGLLSGVIGRALDAVQEASPGPWRAWVGPHICAACYEVPEAMAADAAARLGTSVPTTRWGTSGIDLGAAALLQLRARDVSVTAVAACTLEDARLHSHRRDPAAGRLAAVIWLAP